MCKHWPIIAVVVYIFLLGPVWWLLAFSSGMQEHADTVPKLSALRLYNQSATVVAEWDREKAIDFAFKSTSKAIDYLFIAAIGVIAFVVKTLVIDTEKKVSASPESARSPCDKWCILFTLLGFGLSAINGIFAFCYFPKLATQAEFCLYSEVAILSLGQQMAFVVSLIALSIVVVRRIFEPREPCK